MSYANESQFLIYYSHEMDEFKLNINLACDIHEFSISWINLSNINF